MTVSSESPFLDIFVDSLSAEVGDETATASTGGEGNAALIVDCLWGVA